MWSIIPLAALLFAKAATCGEVTYLHLTNLHPAHLPEALWPRIYREIISPISEDLPALFIEQTPSATENRKIKKIANWIYRLFPKSNSQTWATTKTRPFEAGQVLHPGTPFFDKDTQSVALSKREGFVLARKLDHHETYDLTAIVWFDPEMPPFDVFTILKYFDEYKMPRPALVKAIPGSISYHPNYSEQPPFDSSASLPYIASMTNQLLRCLFHGKPQVINELRSLFKAWNLIVQQMFLTAFWDLLIPGTHVIPVSKSSVVGNKPPGVGETISLMGHTKAKIVFVRSLSAEQPHQDVHLVAIIPENAYMASEEGQELRELFYSQKMWDFGQGKDVPEAAELMERIVNRVWLRAKLSADSSDTLRSALSKVPHQIRSKSLVVMRLNGICRATNISSRFESAAVGRAVKTQYLHAFYNRMLPNASELSD